MDLSKSVVHGVASKDSGIYLSKATEELYKKIEFFSKRGGSLLIITGENRTGKTTFAKYLAEHLSMDEYETILLSVMSDEVKSGWLLPKVCTRLGVEFGNKNLSLSEFLSTKLEELFEENKNLTIIIDGAERLRSSDSFEEIEFLSDIQNLSENKINFILLGEDVLLERIKTTPLINRISYFCTFPLLDKDEIYDYFCYRSSSLNVPKSLISEEGIEYICQLSEGKIANVVMILDNCLIEAKLKNIENIDKRMINEVVGSHILLFKENGVNLSLQDNQKLENDYSHNQRPQDIKIPIPDVFTQPPQPTYQDGKSLSTQHGSNNSNILKHDVISSQNKRGSIDKLFDSMYSQSTGGNNPFSEENENSQNSVYDADDEEQEFLKLLKKNKVKT